MKIKRIFCDMDGTLLNNEGKVSDSNAALIREAGIPITLVSARAPMEMKEATDALQLKGVQVAFNGGLIYTIGNHHQVLPIHVQTIKHKTVKQLLRGIRQHFPQVSLSYYDMNNWYCDKIDEGIQYEQSLTRQMPTFIDNEETAAFGDGHNDLPMLEMVGYPIVMDNAFDDIKAIAYKITKSNDEDGVGYGIHKFLK